MKPLPISLYPILVLATAKERSGDRSNKNNTLVTILKNVLILIKVLSVFIQNGCCIIVLLRTVDEIVMYMMYYKLVYIRCD